MFYLLWDASALAQRYAPEIGQPTVDALFACVPRTHMISTVMSYAETCGVLVRRKNRGDLDSATFTVARSALRAEVIDDLDFGILAVEYGDILDGINLIDRHSLNSTDAAILASFLGFAKSQSGSACMLVAADLRLLRAATSEGLGILNPEITVAGDIPALLAAL